MKAITVDENPNMSHADRTRHLRVVQDITRLLPPPQVCDACNGTGLVHEGRHGVIACMQCNGEGVV